MIKVLVDFLIGCFRPLFSSPEKLNNDVLEYALREHQFYCANFDALDLKANGIMQFVAVVLGLSAFQSSLTGNLGIIRVVALGLFALAMLCAICAWCVRGMQGIPSSTSIHERLEDVGVTTTRQELISCISESSKTANKLILQKIKWLKGSFILLAIGVVLLIISITTA